MKENRTKVGLLIHGFAAAHAATAAVLSQTLIGDEAALTYLTGTMIVAIAKMNNTHWTLEKAMRFLGLFFGKYAGTRAATFLIKWVPGIGNAANAAVTFSITEIIGWSTYLFLSDHGDSDFQDFSDKERDEYWKKAMNMRDNESETITKLYQSMDEKDRSEYDAIMIELQKKLPEDTREYFIDRIDAIVQKYACKEP